MEPNTVTGVLQTLKPQFAAPLLGCLEQAEEALCAQICLCKNASWFSSQDSEQDLIILQCLSASCHSPEPFNGIFSPKAEALGEESKHPLDVLSLSQQEIYAPSTWRVKNNSQDFMLEFDVLFFQTLFLRKKSTCICIIEFLSGGSRARGNFWDLLALRKRFSFPVVSMASLRCGRSHVFPWLSHTHVYAQKALTCRHNGSFI